MTTRIQFKADAPISAQQRTALTLVCDAILEAVKAAGPTGAPGGTLYAALMAQGCSLQTFEQLMSMLVSVGALTRDGRLYQLSGTVLK